MNTYCLKCKKNTSNIDPKMVKTKKIDYLSKQNVMFVRQKSQDL